MSAAAESMPGTESILSVRDLSVGYETGGGVVNAVNEVSFTLHRDEILAVIGESGSGKTSLARGVLGLLPATGRVTAGSIELAVDGPARDVLALKPSQLRDLRGTGIGFVPQATAGALNPVQRISAHFKVTLKAHGVGWASGGRDRAERALADAGLPDPAPVLHSYPHELSGGMAQRVVVALASVLSPAVLIADEPTSALDVTVQRRLLDNLAASVRRDHRGVVIITHDIRIARSYCDSVLVMYGGYAVESGPVDTVLAEPRHPYTRALLAAMPGGHERARTRLGGTGVQLPGAVSARCPYYAQCGVRADTRCSEAVPPFRKVAPRHHVRSFYG